MQTRLPKRSFATLLALCAAVILVAMPFHATVTVWLSSLVGHYTGIRLWKEWLLWPMAAGVLYLCWRDKDLKRVVAHSVLARLVAAYVAVEVAWGLAAYALGHVALPALLYGWISDTRYLIFFVIVWVIAPKAPSLYKLWPKLIFWPAAAVVAFGLAQYFLLPYDFMAHLGYSSATIFPYETINHNLGYVRVMSTLRGANPLGAYLVVVLSLLAAVALHSRRQLAQAKNRWRLAGVVGLTAGGLVVLVLTFSRSAWLGLGLSVALLLWASLRSQQSRRLVLASAAVCVLLVGAVVYGLRNDTTFQNVFFHTQTHSAVPTTSNEGHMSALQNGLLDVIHQPLGDGPGTAGPASAYNTGHVGRIAENYFVQIAQETGIAGLGLFAAINVVLAWKLWQRRRDPLALGLLAGLAGISLIGLLSHVWADDTLAYIWWGLAAVALAQATPGRKTPAPKI